MKTVITGGYGMVGSAMESQIKLSRDICDLTNTKQTEALFKTIKPEGVIHCAGKVGGIGGNSNFKGEYFYDNLMINTNVIEASRKAGVKRLVAFLSTCVFPDNVSYPLTVDQVHQGEPHSSNYPYAYAKRMADVQIRAYREQYGLNYTSIIPSNIYGPNDNFNLDTSHVIPALISKCFEACMHQQNFEVWGTGKAYREFVYSKDVAKIVQWVLENYDDPEPLIISPDEEISIATVAQEIAWRVGYTNSIVYNQKMDGQLRKPSDNSKLKSLLPNFKFTPIEEGIQETTEWYVKNKYEARK